MAEAAEICKAPGESLIAFSSELQLNLRLRLPEGEKLPFTGGILPHRPFKKRQLLPFLTFPLRRVGREVRNQGLNHWVAQVFGRTDVRRLQLRL